MNLSIGITGLLISILGLMQVLISPFFEKWNKRFFVTFFSLLLAWSSMNLIGQVAEPSSTLIAARISRFSLFWESLLPSILTLLLTVYLLYSSGETKWRSTLLFRLVFGIWVIYLVLLIYTQFSTVIYHIDDQNVYHRGSLYPLLLVPIILIMLLDIAALIRRGKALSFKQRLAFWIYLAFPAVSIVVQLLFYGLYLILLGSSIATVFMFNYIWLDQSERYFQQLQENAKLRQDIMFSQIQPHFLYNTLSAIQSLCRSDPAKAEEAVVLFSRYLRGNMDSITQTDTIPFSSELEHTRLYLQLEKLRYEDALQVSYDLACLDFRIPTLTLQPLAENAVRHGVRGKISGCGSVTISSRETDEYYSITVCDDGPGFSPENTASDGRPHIGLTNVRERLARVCGGRLEIESQPGHGTKVTILIPKED